jgi:hypothetical protein
MYVFRQQQTKLNAKETTMRRVRSILVSSILTYILLAVTSLLQAQEITGTPGGSNFKFPESHLLQLTRTQTKTQAI